ncbi:hypothetical protein I917_25430 [Mycobacterium tuberculosis str. Haarlem/NITR202]|uniref:Uncharacterized protein n=1 Tax=Mycobacterium tuberculosis str. Haarlem/NITR202 TaxID=1304279 RepID=R4MB58_MYCTX|nr:hypothetical protein I917_25430 [Mycobacterium tuberculosis str. Haarlem/NITR202]
MWGFSSEGSMSTFRIFGFSLLMTVVALVTGYLHGGPTALFLLAGSGAP